MQLPRWLDDELHGRGAVLGAAAVLIALMLGWLVWAQVDKAEAPLPAAAQAVMPAPKAPPIEAPVEVAATDAPSAPAELPRCPHQALDIMTPDGLQRGCVSATRTRQSGSVRSFMVDAEGVSTWRLVVDVVGEKLLSARLERSAVGTAPVVRYVCDGKACVGGSLGAADANGERTLSLLDLRLKALPPGQRWQPPQPGVRRAKPPDAPPAAERPTVTLSAALKIQPDRQTALICPGPTVTVVQSQGSVVDFCPLGGAGFEIADDGQLRFAFQDLEGRQLTIALRSDQSIDSVALGALSCRYPSCGGVSMSAKGPPGDPAVERSFAFSGTTLGPARPGGLSAALTGAVVMPAQ